MSENLDAIVARLRSGSTYDDRTDAADLIEAQEAEITRLRAALKWAIERDGDDLLICEGDHERHEGCTIQRWVKAENVATARREGMKEAAQRALEYARTAWQHGSLPVDPHECAAQVAREIAGSIAALAGVKPGEHLSEAEQERDVFFNRLGRITEDFGLPMDATASRILEAIEERKADEREACASVEVRLTVPDGAETWTPLEAWEEAIIAFDEAFRGAIRAAAGEVMTERLRISRPR